MEYFRRRPPEWRADNRAAVIAITSASAFGGSKLKPEDLFSSLRVIQEEATNSDISVGEKFFKAFKSRMTEELPFDV